jgi:hypothetical protein
MDCINNLPDDKLNEMLEKYTKKYERYYFFVNEETERSKQKVDDITNELKRRAEFRELLNTKKPKPDTTDIYYELVNHM